MSKKSNLELQFVMHGYYRAYGFEFAAEEIAKGLEKNMNCVVGQVYGISSCENFDVSQAKTLPEIVLEEQDETEEARSARLKEAVNNDPDYYIDPEQDMARIKFEIKEDTYEIYLKHSIGLYKSGKKLCIEKIRGE